MDLEESTRMLDAPSARHGCRLRTGKCCATLEP